MDNLGPDGDGWHLREAVMRFAAMYPATSHMLASIRQDMQELSRRGIRHREPKWWFPQVVSDVTLPAPKEQDNDSLLRDLSLTTGAVETIVWHTLLEGKLICWARPRDPIAVRVPLPADAWTSLKIADWADARLRDLEGTFYYGARIKPPPRGTSEDQAEPKSNGFSRVAVRRFFRETYIPLLNGRQPDREEMVADVRRLFGDGVPKKFVYQLRAEYAPGELKKPGRRKSGGI